MPTVPPIPTLGRHNPRIAEVREIVRRGRPGVAVVDGRKLLLDLVAAGVTPGLVLLTENHFDILQLCPRLGSLVAAGRVCAVHDDVMQGLAPTRHPQGVLALASITTRSVPPDGLVAYLDRIQDPANVGAIVRCAAALGAVGVACSPGCANPFSPRAIRAAAGQTLLFPVATNADFATFAGATRAGHGQVVALAGAGGIPLPNWRAPSSLLLALGNEGAGLDPDIQSACDVVVTIPLHRGVESLNVAVAAGIAFATLRGLALSPILE